MSVSQRKEPQTRQQMVGRMAAFAPQLESINKVKFSINNIYSAHFIFASPLVFLNLVSLGDLIPYNIGAHLAHRVRKEESKEALK